MDSTYLPLTYVDVAIAAGLVILNAALSIALELGLARRLLLAAARMTVQLVLVGLVLKTLFEISSPWLTAAAALFMALVAGREILARQETPLSGSWGYGIGTTSILIAGSLVTIFGLVVQIGEDPWYAPRYALPLFGMILGNGMTGIALGLDTLTAQARRERAAIEANLCLGATRWQAMRPFIRRALSTGMMPIINAMSATGVVSLPGMMTGQILSGVAPTEAVKYQLLVMFLIAGSTGLGVLGAVYATALRLTDPRHRLRLDRLRAKTE
ncbi:MAG: iron export ABC transporter permease subunit FetB [Hyphomicrobiales bacterium]|nr:MAG: iron export ABC transporter permease subunit FetB [Hyphomicrobiales bacterium]